MRGSASDALPRGLRLGRGDRSVQKTRHDASQASGNLWSQQAMRKAGAAARARPARSLGRLVRTNVRPTDQPSVCSSRTRAPCPSLRGSHAAARSTPALCVSTRVAAANRASLLTPSLRLHLLRSSVPKLCYAGACGPSRRRRLVTEHATGLLLLASDAPAPASRRRAEVGPGRERHRRRAQAEKRPRRFGRRREKARQGQESKACC